MDASQPLIQGSVYVNNNTTLSMYDASTYEGVQWPDEIANTVKAGVPAWGNAQFSNSTAWITYCLCWLGISGMHRIYLGDTCCGIAYCLTGGLFLIGDLYDLCSLSSMVEEKNQIIRNVFKEKQDRLARSGPTIIIQPGQPAQPPQYAQPAQVQQPAVQPQPSVNTTEASNYQTYQAAPPGGGAVPYQASDNTAVPPSAYPAFQQPPPGYPPANYQSTGFSEK